MAEELKYKFIEYTNTSHLFGRDDTIIAAISGGVDSVVLAHLLHATGHPMVLAHCNFNLRGAESMRDEQFVRSLAIQWGVTLFAEQYDTEAFARKHKLSVQVAARQLRYDYFERLRQQLSTPAKKVWIATAHNANDAAETMLMNLFRGTGIDGLKGIPEKNGYIIRPVLFATRQQIEAYAKVHELNWVEDSSNEKQDYTRNYVRHTILPAIEKQYPAVLSNLMGTIRKLKDASGLYHEKVSDRLRKLIARDGLQQSIPIKKIEKDPYRETLIWEWIKPYGFSEGQVEEVIRLFNAENGSYLANETFRILRNRAWLILSPVATGSPLMQVVDVLPANYALSRNMVFKMDIPRVHQASSEIPALPPNEALIDAKDIRLPLLLRPWKQGDYFYPLGMQKKKKVARFLIDQKVSPIDKEHIWVLEIDKRIVWVVGYRIDDRFKLTAKTRERVHLQLKKN